MRWDRLLLKHFKDVQVLGYQIGYQEMPMVSGSMCLSDPTA